MRSETLRGILFGFVSLVRTGNAFAPLDVGLSSIQPLIDGYQHALQTDALRTQMATGVALAVAGDAIAQQRGRSAGGAKEPYDLKRAASFASFDGVYRAAQHWIYPPMIALCSGSVLGSAPLEQALASQLIIIPIVYYPVFYAVTGVVQGLSIGQTIERAKESFWPIMLRNWTYWIPIQYSVFTWVEGDAQIPILIACGLVWTVILSILVGEAKEPQPAITSVGTTTVVDLPEETMRGIDLTTVASSSLPFFSQNQTVYAFVDDNAFAREQK
jgi:protein Mpv17